MIEPQNILAQKIIKGIQEELIVNYLDESNSKSILCENGKDLKIEADKCLHLKLLKLLTGIEDIPVLSEEAEFVADEFNKNERFWVLDPLDGSFNFSRNLPLCCISIALMEFGKPVLGVIFDFNRGDIYAGGTHLPATLNGLLIQCSQISDPQRAIAFTGIPLLNRLDQEAFIEFKNIFLTFKKVRMIGTAALSLAWVAAGKAEVYIENSIRLWDVAAGLAIVEASGGKIKFKHTSDFSILDVYASNGRLQLWN